jgi:putative molybdopterin biosynthesis protein
MKREFYLETVSLEEARARWRELWRKCGLAERLGSETIPVDNALGRVTAKPAFAAVSSPHYHAAAMDGLAVRAEETFGASETNPLRLTVPQQAAALNTGEALPEGFDAVIKIEDVQEMAGAIEIIAPVPPWNDTRPVGEDIVITEMVLPAGQRLRPADLAGLLAAGLTQVEVKARPKALIFPTGGEIIQPGEPLHPGSIIEFNSRMLGGRLTELGCDWDRRPILPDDAAAIAGTLNKAAEEADLVLIIAGASAGSRDFTSAALRQAGELIVHGVAIRPGKPTVLGRAGNTPVVGVPGYAVSAALCFDCFIAPLICHMLGAAEPRRETRKAILSRKVFSPAGMEEFIRVRLGVVGDRLVAAPLGRGAGLIMSLVKADGMAHVPAFSEGVHAGGEIEVELLRPWGEIEGALLMIGSHDPSLDLLDYHLRRRYPDLSLSSIHVGSLSGLRALKEGFCHLAGSHLLQEDGEYNIGYVKQLFGAEEMAAVCLARREQGFMVAPGNPKQIGSWKDLTRPEVRFINRQRGAGTRVLTDFELQKAGIEAGEIAGYEREVYTHLAVAAAVKSTEADVGVGVLAAAKALGLDFVPLAKERYELILRRREMDSDKIRALFSVLSSEGFKAELTALGGYDITKTGETRDC